MTSLYTILGVPEKSPPDEIKQAYRKNIKKWHPDLHRGQPTEKEALAKTREINDAYSILNDPDKKELYNKAGRLDPPCVDDLAREQIIEVMKECIVISLKTRHQKIDVRTIIKSTGEAFKYSIEQKEKIIDDKSRSLGYSVNSLSEIKKMRDHHCGSEWKSAIDKAIEEQEDKVVKPLKIEVAVLYYELSVKKHAYDIISKEYQIEGAHENITNCHNSDNYHYDIFGTFNSFRYSTKR